MKVLLLASLVMIADAIIRCKNCNGVPRMSECTQTTECGDGESCYTRKLTTPTGQLLYESGCLSNKVCSILPQLGRRAVSGSLTNCYQCCSSGENCNDNLCGQKHGAETRCYSCADVLRPTDCSTTTVCPIGQKCFIHSIKSDQVHTLNRFQLGCKTNVFCDALAHVSVQTGCNECCDDDYCNIRSCGSESLLPPTITHYPNNKTASNGETVTLQCTVETKTNPTIRWTYNTLLPGTTALPNGVTFSNDNMTISFQASGQTYGNWTCIATNSIGSSKGSAFVKPISSASSTTKPTTTKPSTTQRPPTTKTPKPTTTTPKPATTTLRPTTPKPTTTTPKPTTTTPKPTTTTPKPTTTTSKPTTTTPLPTTTTPKPTTTTPKPTTTTPKPTTTTPKPTTTTPKPTTTTHKPTTTTPKPTTTRKPTTTTPKPTTTTLKPTTTTPIPTTTPKPTTTTTTPKPTTTTPQPTTTTPKPTTVSQDNCVDDDPRCASDLDFVFNICSDSVNFIKCRKTCKACDVTPAPATACVDQDSRCEQDFNYAFTVCSSSTLYTKCLKTCKAC